MTRENIVEMNQKECHNCENVTTDRIVKMNDRGISLQLFLSFFFSFFLNCIIFVANV